MYRIELNRDRLKMHVLNKEQARSIDYIEAVPLDTLEEASICADDLGRVLHDEVWYRIVPLGELVGTAQSNDEMPFDIGGSD